MKISEIADIEKSFNKIFEFIDENEKDEMLLGVLIGSLSLNLNNRIKQIEQGVIKTNDGELNRLQNSLNCLTSKINNANFQSLVTEVNAAYHAYSPKH